MIWHPVMNSVHLKLLKILYSPGLNMFLWMNVVPWMWNWFSAFSFATKIKTNLQKKTILSITLIGNRFILIPILISYVVFTFTHWRTPSHGSTGSGRRNLYFFETDKLFKNVKNCDIYTFKLINGSNVQNCNYSQGW